MLSKILKITGSGELSLVRGAEMKRKMKRGKMKRVLYLSYCRVYPSWFCRIRSITNNGKCADELYDRHFAQMKKEDRACAMSSFHRRLFAARVLLERAIARTSAAPSPMCPG
ncbi:MAG TPA: hypothetical protein VI140_02590 [Oxalicibacterium sp.]